jgi:hypothetical protein
MTFFVESGHASKKPVSLICDNELWGTVRQSGSRKRCQTPEDLKEVVANVFYKRYVTYV